MSSRHQARETALQILYRYDGFTQGASSPTALEITRELQHHFEHFKVSDGMRQFVAQLVSGTLLERGKLDQLLEKHTSHWKIGRMGMIDRSLLRMALYELTSMPETPPSVVIDEAVELAKQFGTGDTPAFVNGVLDAIRLALRDSPAS